MSATRYVDSSVRSFLLNLAGRSPEPAGGAALAVAGASAAALVSLACHTAARRQTREGDIEPAIRECHASSDDLAERIQSLVDADVEAYQGVRKALNLPRNGRQEQAERYHRELDEALHRAIDIPIALAEACLGVLDIAAKIAPSVQAPVTGDLVSAVHLAEAAIKGSLRNARLNAGSLTDQGEQLEAMRRIDEIADRFAEQRRRTARSLSESAPEFAEDV